MIWHNSTSTDVVSELNSDINKGLYNEAADMRLNTYGKNVINNFSSKKLWQYLLGEVKSFINILLIVLSTVFIIVSANFHEPGVLDALVIIVAVAAKIFFSAYFNFRKSDEFNKLKENVLGKATVIRNGEESVIDASELVPGDIMVLKTGDYIMADARLIDSYVLKCDQFKLTGETVPAEKMHDILYDDITPLEDRHNMVYRGTCVVNGRGIAIVTETGLLTEIGKVKKIENHVSKHQTPTEHKIKNLGKYVFFTAIFCSLIIFLIGMFVDKTVEFAYATKILRYLLIGLTICFCATKSFLPTVLEFNLTAVITRLKKHGAIITNLNCADSLKDINVICTDKTGSITTGDMSVTKIFTGNNVTNITESSIDEASATVIRLALICSNFDVSQHIERHGNNLESAIEKAAIKHLGMSKLDIDGIYPKLAELPFDSERMLMTTVSAINGIPYSIVKGAPEIVLSRCNNIEPKQITKTSDAFASDGLKVIAVAIKPLEEIPANPNSDELENDLTFVGLLGIEDAIDEQVFTLCKECSKQSIKVVMITGDHPNTAIATAKKMGIAEDESQVICSEALSKMSDEELAEKINNYTVFARITPEDKLRIVKVFKENGNQVLVTGDNANDTPALIEADISCALGVTASDMVKDTADLVLTDNRFSSLITAIKEANKMHNNIVKSSGLFLSVNAALILTLLFGIIIFGTSPLGAAAILVINLFAVVILAAIALDPLPQLLEIKTPTNLLNKDFIVSVLVPVVVSAILALVGFGLCLPVGKEAAVAVAFAVLTVCNTVIGFKSCFHKTAFTPDIIKNKTMNIACIVIFGILLIFTITPVGKLLSLATFNLAGWLTVLTCLIVVFFTDELTKLILR